MRWSVPHTRYRPWRGGCRFQNGMPTAAFPKIMYFAPLPPMLETVEAPYGVVITQINAKYYSKNQHEATAERG